MNMKKIGMQVSILMSVTLSFCLSLAGNLMSGHFTPVGFIVSFVASTVISLIIGLFVPMKKLGDAAAAKAGLDERSLPARLLTSLISDLIYTPFITLAMVFLAYKNATKNGADMSFLPMFLKSLVSSLLIGYVLIFIFTPLYVNLVVKHNSKKQ